MALASMFNRKEIRMMNTPTIRTVFFAFTLTAVAAFGLSACDTGTQPGDTNVERSDHHEEGSMVGDDTKDQTEAERDTMEQYYERTEEGSAVHAGDGKSDGTDRDDVKEQQ
ncbi:hypothetical protein [Pontibacter flavimaris]|uniref:Uncharacterized protein n=1 Tax=Pontibacter flavimaris TaxID=1797110 RepID=A0A1Q5P9S4_9BACT|nr:hypothetical protein [Pontibacter flavimaris]OKL39000.1 hypothetical protein A3841_03360 [Pontibacter flavimaris]